jgi:hypothetical protein
VTKYKKRRELNVGVLVFLFIFVYVIISVYLFFTKEHLSIYEVKEGSTSDNNIFTGLIIRDEEVIETNNAGYITYYHRDGDRVAKNSTIFTVDKNQSNLDLLGDSDSIKISKEDSAEINHEILKFQSEFNHTDYSKVYDFKYELENTVLQVVNDSKLSNLQTLLKDNGTSSTLQVSNSTSSGIITYYIDNMENLSADDITAENFNEDNYNKLLLRTMDLVESNSPVYKIVKSDFWSIVLLIDEKQYEKIVGTEKDYIKITFKDDDLTTTVPITAYKKGSDYFARLDIDRYMIRYINQRFINIELEINSAKGLKIPVSSIVQKDFYAIPFGFFEAGGNSNSKGLIIEDYTQNNNGEVNYIFTPTEIYYSDEEYAYVDTKICSPGTWIYSQETGERYQVSLTQSLEGVFNINKGYAIFRRIEILYDNEEYCIIKKGTEYGLSVYDHIALNGETAVEQSISN